MEKIRLRDIAEVITKGTTPTSVGFDFCDSGINFVKIESISEDGTFIPSKFAHISKECDKKLARSQLKENDILFSIAGAIGRTAIVSKNILPANTNQALAIIRVPKGKLNYSYLLYVLNSPDLIEQFEKQKQGVAQLNLSLQNVGDFFVPIRPINEQVHIVSILDKVSRLIYIRRQQIAKLDELVKARFVEMFGDPTINPYGLEVVPLSKIAKYFNGLTYKPDNVSDTGTIVLRSSNIQNNQLDFADIVRINCQIKERLFVKENDILMCSRNGSARLVGKVALINQLHEPMSFGAFMMIIRSQYYPYLMTYFQTDDFRRQIKTGATTTINQITGHMLDEVNLPIPTLKDMAVFTSFTKQISKQKLTIQQSLDKLVVLKKSLMQEIFG